MYVILRHTETETLKIFNFHLFNGLKQVNFFLILNIFLKFRNITNTLLELINS